MTMRENILDIHGVGVEYKEHLAVCPKHDSREMGLNMAAYFESGKGIRFPIDQVASILDHVFYDQGKKLGDYPTCIDAAVGTALESVLDANSKSVAKLAGVTIDMPEAGDKLRAVIIACESLTCPPEYEKIVGIDQQDEGDVRLRVDFETNPASQVQEALMTCIIEDDLCGGVEWVVCVQTYAKADGGGIEWGEPSIVISDHDDMTKEDREFTVRTTPQLRAAIPHFNKEVQ